MAQSVRISKAASSFKWKVNINTDTENWDSLYMACMRGNKSFIFHPIKVKELVVLHQSGLYYSVGKLGNENKEYNQLL